MYQIILTVDRIKAEEPIVEHKDVSVVIIQIKVDREYKIRKKTK